VAFTNTMCVSFLVDLFNADQDFSADTTDVFKMALYTSAATLDETTTAYTATNEVADGGGYTAGGEIVTIATNPTSSGLVAFLDLDDVTWATSNITSRGALLYNSSVSNKSVMVIDFGIEKTTSGGNFVVNIPASNSSSAILRLNAVLG
jgi:hypothetical protein